MLLELATEFNQPLRNSGFVTRNVATDWHRSGGRTETAAIFSPPGPVTDAIVAPREGPIENAQLSPEWQ